MVIKNSTLLILLALLSISCSRNQKLNQLKVQKKTFSSKCCDFVYPNGECRHELIPGCTKDSAPLFKKSFEESETFSRSIENY